ncbi:MAG: hypothetical protein LBQ14_10485 [Treponema sp.]|jgi:hypothetical protein|nr:hypothetical protein [Treponema sp.]
MRRAADRIVPERKCQWHGGRRHGGRRFFPALFTLFLLLGSCRYEPALSLAGFGPGVTLSARSREAAAGLLSFSRPRKLEYVLKGAVLPPDLSFQLEYTLRPEGPELSAEDRLALRRDFASRYQLICTLGAVSWILPQDLSFLGSDSVPGLIRYALPVEGTLERIVLSVKQNQDQGGQTPPGNLILEVRSFSLVSRWFGWDQDLLSSGGSSAILLSASPFVFRDGAALAIDPPEEYRIAGMKEIAVDGVEGGALLDAGRSRYEYRAPPGGPPESFVIPPGVVSANPYPLILADWRGASIRITHVEPPVFPEPVPADPGLIIDYPRRAWRDSRFEIFRWDRFPLVLIFDTADYALQDRFFKRLAFFVEKAGFRGRLTPDAEIAGLHGWNAYDYRAEDLARFFEAARTANFLLLPEEQELKRILLDNGIIREGGVPAGGVPAGGVPAGGVPAGGVPAGGIPAGGIPADGIVPGTGAVISISRESNDYLRGLFMAHESFHGLFFIDEDFREFSRRRWEALPQTARRFILSYFDYSQYDLTDAYLMVNELMAYCLQQSPALAAEYFGKTLAGRLEKSWRRRSLPVKNEAAGTWPELERDFSREAAAFSAYVDQRWGFSGGRVHRITRSLR